MKDIIDKNSHIPMYEQIANILRSEIISSKYSENRKIGSQKELIDRFKVSVITIRKALSILEKEEVIIRKQGKGTYTNKSLFQDKLNGLTGLSNIISKKGYEAEIEIRKLDFVETPDYFDKKIKAGFKDRCLYIERIHKIENIPIGIAKIYIPYDIGINMKKIDLEQNTIYEIFEKKLGIELGTGIQTIKANKADKSLADILLIEENSPILEVERVAYDNKGALIEYITLFYEYDKYEFKVELKLNSSI